MTGPTLAGGIGAAAARYPTADAIVDDHGALTYRRLWTQSDAVARALRDAGVGEGSVVGLLHRNHRGFVISLVAAAKVGADIVYLNTGFAGPQLADVVRIAQLQNEGASMAGPLRARVAELRNAYLLRTREENVKITQRMDVLQMLPVTAILAVFIAAPLLNLMLGA